jgi:hypothetical protein
MDELDIKYFYWNLKNLEINNYNDIYKDDLYKYIIIIDTIHKKLEKNYILVMYNIYEELKNSLIPIIADNDYCYYNNDNVILLWKHNIYKINYIKETNISDIIDKNFRYTLVDKIKKKINYSFNNYFSEYLYFNNNYKLITVEFKYENQKFLICFPNHSTISSLMLNCINYILSSTFTIFPIILFIDNIYLYKYNSELNKIDLPWYKLNENTPIISCNTRPDLYTSYEDKLILFQSYYHGEIKFKIK